LAARPKAPPNPRAYKKLNNNNNNFNLSYFKNNFKRIRSDLAVKLNTHGSRLTVIPKSLEPRLTARPNALGSCFAVRPKTLQFGLITRPKSL